MATIKIFYKTKYFKYSKYSVHMALYAAQNKPPLRIIIILVLKKTVYLRL